MTRIINPDPEKRTEEEKRLVEILQKPDHEEIQQKLESGAEKLKADIALDYFRLLVRTQEMDNITKEIYLNAIDVLTTYLQIVSISNNLTVVNQNGNNNIKINYVKDLKL